MRFHPARPRWRLRGPEWHSGRTARTQTTAQDQVRRTKYSNSTALPTCYLMPSPDSRRYQVLFTSPQMDYEHKLEKVDTVLKVNMKKLMIY